MSSLHMESTSRRPDDDSIQPNSIVQFLTRPFSFGPDAPIEATGAAVDIFARATIGMSAMFLGPALLELASMAAGCPDSEDSDADCDLTIHGFHPSSLLTIIAVVSSIIVSVTLPVFGSIVDHTRFRRHVGAYTAAGLTIIKAIEISIGPKTWVLIAALQVLVAFLFQFHLTATYAYVSELSTDSTQQSKYNSSFYVVMYTATLMFLMSVTGISLYLQTDEIGTARISQSLTTAICLTVFCVAWSSFFRDRPASSEIPDGMNIVSCGFHKVSKTLRTISAENQALKWLMLAVSFSEAGSAALITVSTTYMKSFLKMSSSEISIVFLAVLLSGIPGSLIGNYITKKFRDPMPSVIISNTLFIFSTLGAAAVLTGPEHKGKSFIFGILWGVALGWLHPQHTTLFVSIIPGGQEAELMGMYLLCCQILAWLPPMVFTVLNELEFSMTIGLGSLTLFFMTGIFCLTIMRKHQRAGAIEAVVPYENIMLPTSGESC